MLFIILSITQITDFLNVFDHRPMSKKGYTLGARTAVRFREYIDVCNVKHAFQVVKLDRP